MYKKFVLFAVICTIVPCITLAQNSVNSPYTRYGYGDLSDRAFAPQRAMGGIGYGLRSPQMINPMNPASFSGVDSLTFMIDMGITGHLAWFEDPWNKERKINGGLEYLAIQFPLMKKLGFGAGLEPVSTVGYQYLESSESSGTKVNKIYQGSGGLSRVYTSLSYDIFNRLSIGVKAAYLFGDIYHNKTTSLDLSSSNSLTWRDTIRSSGLTCDIGLQYHQPIGKYQTLVIGAVYSPKNRFNGRATGAAIVSDAAGNITNTHDHYSSNDSVFEMAETYALGITYNKLNKLTVGADILYQKWADAKFYDKPNELRNMVKVNVGGEYIPNLMSNNYLNRVRYRAGIYYMNSYLKVKDLDAGYKKYGVSAGIGLPMTDRRSFINLALEYSFIRPDEQFIDEQYFKLTVSYTFNELWFFKRKVQ